MIPCEILLLINAKKRISLGVYDLVSALVLPAAFDFDFLEAVDWRREEEGAMKGGFSLLCWLEIE